MGCCCCCRLVLRRYCPSRRAQGLRAQHQAAQTSEESTSGAMHFMNPRHWALSTLVGRQTGPCGSMHPTEGESIRLVEYSCTRMLLAKLPRVIMIHQCSACHMLLQWRLLHQGCKGCVLCWASQQARASRDCILLGTALDALEAVAVHKHRNARGP